MFNEEHQDTITELVGDDSVEASSIEFSKQPSIGCSQNGSHPRKIDSRVSFQETKSFEDLNRK